MAGLTAMIAITVDTDKCAHYAQFASRLKPLAFDVIYWLLFLLVVLMLFCSSWYYGRSMEATDKSPAQSPEYRRQMKKCLLVCCCCAAISVVAVVMETFALLALQFCDGEDLMMLYWSTWTMLQVGSVIAIFGVILHVFHTLRGRKHPPWALALGTPVLIVAGLGHLFNSVLNKRVKARRERRGRSPGQNLPFSQTPTLRTESPDTEEASYNAKLLGYTPDGAPIIQFAERPRSLDHQAAVLSTGQDGQVIVAFAKEMSIIVDREKSRPERPPPTNAGEMRRPQPVPAETGGTSPT